MPGILRPHGELRRNGERAGCVEFRETLSAQDRYRPSRKAAAAPRACCIRRGALCPRLLPAGARNPAAECCRVRSWPRRHRSGRGSRRARVAAGSRCGPDAHASARTSQSVSGFSGSGLQLRRRSSFKPWNRPQSTSRRLPSASTRYFEPVTVPAAPRKVSLGIGATF